MEYYTVRVTLAAKVSVTAENEEAAKAAANELLEDADLGPLEAFLGTDTLYFGTYEGTRCCFLTIEILFVMCTSKIIVGRLLPPRFFMPAA